MGYLYRLNGAPVRCLVLSTSGLVGGGEDLELAVDQMNTIATGLKCIATG